MYTGVAAMREVIVQANMCLVLLQWCICFVHQIPALISSSDYNTPRKRLIVDTVASSEIIFYNNSSRGHVFDRNALARKWYDLMHEHHVSQLISSFFC